MSLNRQILLKSRPTGAPQPENFERVQGDVPSPGEEEVLARTLYLSLDPFLRGRMSDRKSYAAPVELGAVMTGITVSEVIESRHPAFKSGDLVLGTAGWQDYAVLPGKALRKLDPVSAPPSTALGVLGMPGHTAWFGLHEIGRPRAGETVVVSAAAGAVGSVVGQLAKRAQCHVVGIAGGPEKCRYVVDELGFDECVDHRAPDFPENLKRACPNGIDIDFENVGGAVIKALWPLLNNFARVVLCGLIAQYNETGPTPGPDLTGVLTRRLTVQGFIITDHLNTMDRFLSEVAPLVKSGRIRYREHFIDGLENAPAALAGLLEGKNFGKLIVRVAPQA